MCGERWQLARGEVISRQDGDGRQEQRHARAVGPHASGIGAHGASQDRREDTPHSQHGVAVARQAIGAQPASSAGLCTRRSSAINRATANSLALASTSTVSGQPNHSKGKSPAST